MFEKVTQTYNSIITKSEPTSGQASGQSSTHATKEVDGKLRYDLIPVIGLQEEALVYTIGAKKYDDNNWRKGLPYSVCMAALLRHVQAFRAGEQRCPKDGQHHLGSVKFWCNALMEYEQTHPELDDRADIHS